jgi:hypothetical protein
VAANEQAREQAEQPRRVRLPQQLDSAIEQRIREAIERGDFDNLSTRGKPLSLDLKDAYDREAWFVNRTMKSLGAVPPWMELAKEIDAHDGRLRWQAEDFGRWLAETRAALLPLSPEQRAAQRPGVELRYEDRFRRYRELAEQLRREIERFNFEVPVRGLEKPGVWVAHELRRLSEPFAALCAELDWDDVPAEPSPAPTEPPPAEDPDPRSRGRRLLDRWRRAGSSRVPGKGR